MNTVLPQRLQKSSLPGSDHVIPSRLYWQDPLILFSAAVSLLYIILMGRMVDGSFINSYPFITDDGFDWLFQGVALHERITGVNSSAWPVLRNPVYVFISAADAALRANGGLLIATQGAAIFATLMALASLGRQFRQPDPVIAAFLFGFAFMPMSYFRFWVLSDTVAMSLMMVGVAWLMKHHGNPTDRRFLFFSVVISLLAGMTQTYGLIPFCVMASLMVIELSIKRRRVQVDLVLAIVCILLLFLFLQKIWQWEIPHGFKPDSFALLQLNLGMLDFYTNVWVINFLPFVPIVLLLLAQSRFSTITRNTPAIHLFGAFLTFLLMTFSYQWPEARFTYVYMPILFALLLALPPIGNTNRGGRIASYTAIAYGLLGLVMLPGNYWRPQIANIQFAPTKAWIGEVWSTPPVDRFQLHAFCPTIDVICSEAPVPENISVYRLAILNDYKARQVSAASSGRLGAAKPVSARLPSSLALTTPGEMASRKAAPDRSSGYVDVIKRIDDRLLIEGWSLDRIARQPASRIWVVLEGETRFVTIPTVQRDDVTSHFGLTGALKAGFSFVVTIPPELGPQRPAVRVFAEMRNATFTELEIDEKSVQ